MSVHDAVESLVGPTNFLIATACLYSVEKSTELCGLLLVWLILSSKGCSLPGTCPLHPLNAWCRDTQRQRHSGCDQEG